jgi:predicted ATPase
VAPAPGARPTTRALLFLADVTISTPDRRVRVFVSSTLDELASERAAARDAIEELRLTAVMFELGARPHPPPDVYRSYLEQSDVFVGIYGERYGWVAPGMDVSGVEDELRRAAGMPKLLYVKHPAPARDERLDALIRAIEEDAAVSYRRFSGPEQLRRLLADDLAVLLSERFQARSAPARRARSRLPAPVDALIGRERELGELDRRLRGGGERLITVTGPGGVGKTRLAVEAARRTRDAFADGVHLVPLEAVADPARVASSLHGSLELSPSPRPPLDAVTAALVDAELLLVLDNFEHLLSAAPVVVRLLEDCPGLTLLVTSRAILGVRGERELAVAPLLVPGEGASAAEIDRADAVALFVERAQAVNPRFSLTEVNREAVGAICRHLDGLPLAVELAAAQMRLLSPQLVLERLDDRLGLAARAEHAYPDRQRSLRAAIEWSYALLGEEEQTLFARAGVFRGGWTLGALEAVCGAADFDALAMLVETSLVAADARDEPRFSMLPTIRQYAVERLRASGEEEEVRRRHAEHFRALAAEANTEDVRITAGEKRRGVGDMRLDLVQREQDNIRAALEWAYETGNVALGLDLAALVEAFWITGDPREGMGWFSALLGHPAAEETAPEIRARSLLAYGSAAHLSGDVALARRLYERSVSLFDELGHERARSVLLYRLGITAMQRGELDAARRLVEESRGIQVRIGDRWGETQSVGALGAIARESADGDRARELVQASVRLAREIGARWWEGGMEAELAALALAAGDVGEADARARASLAVAEEVGDRPGRVLGVGLLAAVAAERGLHETAGRLWSAVAREDALSPLGGWRRHRPLCESRVLAAPGPARSGGEERTLALDDAVRLALSAANGESARRADR